MKPLHQEWPGCRNPDNSDNTENDRLDEKIETQQARDRGAERPDGYENGKEGQGYDFEDGEGDCHDHPEPVARHRGKF